MTQLVVILSCGHRFLRCLEWHLDRAIWRSGVDAQGELGGRLGCKKIRLLLEALELKVVTLSQDVLVRKSGHLHLLLQVDVCTVRVWSFLACNRLICSGLRISIPTG